MFLVCFIISYTLIVTYGGVARVVIFSVVGVYVDDKLSSG